MRDGVACLTPNYFEELERRGADQLEKVISREDRNTLPGTLVMLKGTAFLEIVRYARDQKMDLIVLGTHGRGAPAHVLMGSVAERLVRKAPCTVMTVRNPRDEFIMP